MKTTVTVKINSIQDVQNFVRIVSTLKANIDLHSGRYIVDGKSIMGIFSLDLMNPIKLVAHSDSPEYVLEALNAVKDFVVDEE